MHALHNVLADASRNFRPARDLALFTEHVAPQLVAQLLHFLRVTCLTKAYRQLEKGLLLFLARLNSLFDELHQDPVIAGCPTQAGFAWVGLLTTNSASTYEEICRAG